MSEDCTTCPANAALAQMGVDVSNFDYLVALAGNPNTGKSTVFNALTGLRQHTGNWPGKTVTRAEGGYQFQNKRYKLVDLPGTYSLLSASQDEEIARNFILFGQPDCTVVVNDATCLERNLNLVLQVLEITDRAVVVVNLMDEARRKAIEVDVRALARDLGVPVVAAAARNGEGLGDILGAVRDIVGDQVVVRPKRVQAQPALEAAISDLLPLIEHAAPGMPNPRWVALRLLDGDGRIREALLSGELTDIAARQRQAVRGFSRKIALQGAQ
jgi:ferrous iron transport protein B